jgi:hypothetical protein
MARAFIVAAKQLVPIHTQYDEDTEAYRKSQRYDAAQLRQHDGSDAL